MHNQLEQAKKKGLTVGTFVSLADDTTINGLCKDHATGNSRSRRAYKILGFSSACWEKKYMDRMFSAKKTLFDTFIQDLFSMSINLLLALYLVFPRSVLNMGPAFMFSMGVETLWIDGYLMLTLLTHGTLTVFHRLMKYVDPKSIVRAHPSHETYSYKCAAGLKTLLVE